MRPSLFWLFTSDILMPQMYDAADEQYVTEPSRRQKKKKKKKTKIGLALNILCGFSADEIARAFLTDKEAIYKRLQRARKKLRTENIKIVPPGPFEMNSRLPAVLMTLYLLYNEGYYSAGRDMSIRRDLCYEAMRLCSLLWKTKKRIHQQ